MQKMLRLDMVRLEKNVHTSDLTPLDFATILGIKGKKASVGVTSSRGRTVC